MAVLSLPTQSSKIGGATPSIFRRTKKTLNPERVGTSTASTRSVPTSFRVVSNRLAGSMGTGTFKRTTPTAYRSLSTKLAGSDSPRRSLSSARKSVDNLTFTTTVSRALSLSRLIQNTLGLSTSLLRGAAPVTRLISVLDTMAFRTVCQKGGVSSRRVLAALQLSTLLSRNAPANRQVLESLGLPTSLVKEIQAIHVRLLQDILALQSALNLASSHAEIWLRSLRETLALYDHLLREVTVYRSFVDLLCWVTDQGILHPLRRWIHEILALSPSLYRESGQFRSIRDRLGVKSEGDNHLNRSSDISRITLSSREILSKLQLKAIADRSVDHGRLVVSSMALFSSLLRQSQAYRTAADSLGLDGTYDFSRAHSRLVLTKLCLVDNRLLLTASARLLHDTLASSDDIEQQATSVRIVTVGLAFLDARQRATDVSRILSNTFAFSTQSTKQQVASRHLYETLAVLEFADRSLRCLRLVSDTLGLQTEVLSVATAKLLKVVDALGGLDSLQRLHLARRKLADKIRLDDETVRFVSWGRSVLDTLALPDDLDRVVDAYRSILDAFGLDADYLRALWDSMATAIDFLGLDPSFVGNDIGLEPTDLTEPTGLEPSGDLVDDGLESSQSVQVASQEPSSEKIQ